MNLHQIVAGSIGTINPFELLSVQVSTGSTTASDGKRTPAFADAVMVPGQVQALTYKDIRQIEGLNLNGTRRAIYLYGEIDGLVRPDRKGGDLITRQDGSVWLTALVLEQWNDGPTPSWVKIAATMQDGT